jgi:hypothetical protein
MTSESDFLLYELTPGVSPNVLISWIIDHLDQGTDLRIDAVYRRCLIIVPLELKGEFLSLFSSHVREIDHA